MDPEDVEAILRPYHGRVRAELEHYGGTVEKFIGDAVMALFGAPIAHEDDPERAVRAALAIREFAVEDGLELRIGITTGEVLVSLDASPAEGEGMASGDVVNTAARLQSAAQVNGVLADETTYRATRQSSTTRRRRRSRRRGSRSRSPSGRQPRCARGSASTSPTRRARSSSGASRSSASCATRSRASRSARTSQLVTLVGVPGLGKSRLVYELSRIVEDDPELITWRQGRCLAYGNGVTLWALGEIVKAQAGIHEQDPSRGGRREAPPGGRGRGADDAATWRGSSRTCSRSSGSPRESELGGDHRGEAFSAWRLFFEAMADQRPLVLVFEDLHWADEGLLDFVDELVDWVTDVPLLVVATARPELLERRPGWGGGKLNATTLALSAALGRADRAPHRPAPRAPAARRRVPAGAPRAGRREPALRGAVRRALPRTRLGRRAAAPGDAAGAHRRTSRRPAARREGAAARRRGRGQGVLDRRARTGRSARPRALLHSLERKGFVRRQRRSSVESEGELAFAHALVRDVAYGQIARADRIQKHRRVAEWIEGLGRPEDHAEMLAHHWSSRARAREGDRRRGRELETRTRLALRDAGARAFALNAFAAAERYYTEALALSPPGDREHALLLFEARARDLRAGRRRGASRRWRRRGTHYSPLGTGRRQARPSRSSSWPSGIKAAGISSRLTSHVPKSSCRTLRFRRPRRAFSRNRRASECSQTTTTTRSEWAGRRLQSRRSLRFPSSRHTRFARSVLRCSSSIAADSRRCSGRSSSRRDANSPTP